MGIRDYFENTGDSNETVVCLVEWPEKGKGILPKPNLDINLTFNQEGRIARLEFASLRQSDPGNGFNDWLEDLDVKGIKRV